AQDPVDLGQRSDAVEPVERRGGDDRIERGVLGGDGFRRAVEHPDRGAVALQRGAHRRDGLDGRDPRARVHDELGELAGPRAELKDVPSFADAELAYEVGYGVVGVARSPALVVLDGDLEAAAGRGVDPIVAHAVAFAVRTSICSWA